MQSNVIPVDGMVIAEDTEFAPGTYLLPNGFSIGQPGVTVRGKGTTIRGANRQNTGVQVRGLRGVTIQDLALSSYHYGIRADDCEAFSIEAVTVRETAEIEGIDTFLYLWPPIQDAYGGAILLHRVRGGAVRNCDLQHQMHGVQLYGCTGITVENNNASFNSGWGVYLSESTENTVQGNQLDFCNRVYRRPEDGAVRVEADAAAIVLVRGSSRNRILRNSCLCGGDGIFVAGYYHPGGNTPCNHNLFEDNDCRLSPNNAIESTFSQGNIFRRNDCSRSNYGFWMGFSWDNVIEDNTVEYNRFVGIAIEHGHNSAIRNNQIRLNEEGIRLWTRGGAVVPYWPGWEVSYNMTIEQNLLEGNRVGFRGFTGAEPLDQLCYGYVLRANIFRDNRVGAYFKRVQDCKVENNLFNGYVEAAIQLDGGPAVAIIQNRFEGNQSDIVRT